MTLSSLSQTYKICGFRISAKALPHVITVALLAIGCLIYVDSIYEGRFFLGEGDRATRFLIAMNYARDPSNAFHVQAWVDFWPPVPFIIQGLVLRFVLFPGMMDVAAGILAVQLTGAIFVLFGFYFISRAIAMQSGELTGLFAFLLCFNASTLLYLAPTTSSEIYANFFVSLAFWNLFRVIVNNHGLGLLLLSFVLAFFCRTESLVLAFVASGLLLVYRRYKSAALLIVTSITIATTKLLGALILVQGTKFFESGKDYGWGDASQDKVAMASTLISQLWFYNRNFILLSCLLALTIAFFVKSRNYSKILLADEHNSINEAISVPPRKIWYSKLSRTYGQIRSWVIASPIIFWWISFLMALGVLLEYALQGNLNAQWRYLYQANVFMTTVIALLAARFIHTLWTRGDRLSKLASFGILLVLVLFSLWSGLSYATGRKVPWTMPSSMKDVIDYIRSHRTANDQIAFDFLLWQETTIQVQLQDPSQPTSLDSDPELIPIVPKDLQAPEKWIAYTHALIHAKHVRFLVLANSQLWEDIQRRLEIEKDIQKDIPIDRIRSYLTRVESTEKDFLFRSPFIYPDETIRFTKTYENDSFIVMERVY